MGQGGKNKVYLAPDILLVRPAAWTGRAYADRPLQRASTDSARTSSEDRNNAKALLDESLAVSSEPAMRPLRPFVEGDLSRRVLLRKDRRVIGAGRGGRPMYVAWLGL